MRKAMLAVALLAVVLAGCRIETNIQVALEADGSGDLLLDVGLDDEALGFIEGFGGEGPSFADSCTEDASGVGDLLGENPLGGVVEGIQQDAEVSVVTEDGLTICRVQLAFDDVESIAGSGVDDGLSFDVTTTDEEVRVTASVDTGQAGADTGGLEDLGFDPGTLADAFAFHLRLKMPGSVIESNADRTLSDGTLEWDIDLFGGGPLMVEAVSDPSGSSGGISPILIVVALLAVAVAAFLWYRSRSGRPAIAGDAPAAGEAPPPPPAPPEPPAEPEGAPPAP